MSANVLLVRGSGKKMPKSLGGYPASPKFRLNYSAFLRYVMYIRQEEMRVGKYTQSQLAEEIMEVFDEKASPEFKKTVKDRIIRVNDISKGINIVQIKRVPLDETIIIYTNWWNKEFRCTQKISPLEFIGDFLEAPDMPIPEGDKIEGDLIDIKDSADISHREYQRWSDWIDSWYEELQEKRVDREQEMQREETVLKAISRPPGHSLVTPFSPEDLIFSLVEDPTIPSSKLAEYAAILLRKAEEGAMELSQQQQARIIPFYYEVKQSKTTEWLSIFTISQYVHLKMENEQFANYLDVSVEELRLMRDGRIPSKSRSLEEVVNWLSEKLKDAQGNSLSPSFFLSFLNGESDGVKAVN